jgi:uncharacterized membrane protein YphA (DoxX/SURF4 family)
MSAVIPPLAIYIGLAGCVIALLVATAQNQWSPRVFLLLALRIAIGWHFMFEGFHKIHSHMVGPTDSNKVFTSEPYFAMADGPLGPVMRLRIGDPAELIKQRIVAAKEPKLALSLKEDDVKGFLEFVPPAVAKEWGDYVKKYSEVFSKGQEIPAGLSDAILVNYAKWVTGVEPGKEMKVRYFQSEVPYTVPQRLAHLAVVTKQLDDLMERQKPGLGHGFGYDQSRITAAKGELRTVRTDLLADSDAVMAEMKKELFAKTAGERLSKFALPSKQLADDTKFADLLTFKPVADKPSFETEVPPLVKGIWNSYLETARNVYADYEAKIPDELKKKRAGRTSLGIENPPAEPGITEAAAFPKQALADWFAKNWAKRVEALKVADKEASAKAKEAVLAELDQQFGLYRNMINNAIPADVLSGVVTVTKPKPIEEMDKFTMWFIAIVGACILFGVLTPVSCLAAVGFLVLTYLTHPPFPWLPLPPNTEGNPLFINKNVIEALALMVIAVHPTGRWLGLDALWTYLFGIGRAKTA